MKYAEDELLSEFLYLQKSCKKVVARLEEIKKQLKARGSFCTENHACVVYEQERRAICGLEEAVDKLGLKELERLKMIKNSKFLVVKVATIEVKESADL